MTKKGFEKAVEIGLAVDSQNVLRFDRNYLIFERFLENDLPHVTELVWAIQDARWTESSQALALAIYEVTRHKRVRSTIAEEFGCLVKMTVAWCFGSTRRITIPPWFLEMMDGLFYRTAISLVYIHEKESANKSELEMEGDWNIYFGLMAACKDYMLFDASESKSALPSLMVSFERVRDGGVFLRIGSGENTKAPSWGGRPIELVHKVFASSISKCILKEWTEWDETEGPKPRVDQWFGGGVPYLVGSLLWQNFLVRVSMATCKGEVSSVHKLLQLIKKEGARWERSLTESPSSSSTSATTKRDLVLDLKDRTMERRALVVGRKRPFEGRDVLAMGNKVFANMDHHQEYITAPALKRIK